MNPEYSTGPVAKKRKNDAFHDAGQVKLFSRSRLPDALPLLAPALPANLALKDSLAQSSHARLRR